MKLFLACLLLGITLVTASNDVGSPGRTLESVEDLEWGWDQTNFTQELEELKKQLTKVAHDTWRAHNGLSNNRAYAKAHIDWLERDIRFAHSNQPVYLERVPTNAIFPKEKSSEEYSYTNDVFISIGKSDFPFWANRYRNRKEDPVTVGLKRYHDFLLKHDYNYRTNYPFWKEEEDSKYRFGEGFKEWSLKIYKQKYFLLKAVMNFKGGMCHHLVQDQKVLHNNVNLEQKNSLLFKVDTDYRRIYTDVFDLEFGNMKDQPYGNARCRYHLRFDCQGDCDQVPTHLCAYGTSMTDDDGLHMRDCFDYALHASN